MTEATHEQTIKRFIRYSNLCREEILSLRRQVMERDEQIRQLQRRLKLKK